MTKKSTIGVFSLSIVMLLLLGPLLHDHFTILAGRRHYQWFPLLLALLPIVLFIQWRKAEPAEDRPMAWALFLLVFGAMLLTAVAYLYYTSWLSMAAFIVVIGVLLAHLSSYRKVDRLFALWALLFLLVRLPNQIERRLLILFQNIIQSIILDDMVTEYF